MVIEFPSYADALACYRSPEYAQALALRQGRSVVDLTIVEGYDGLQPLDGCPRWAGGYGPRADDPLNVRPSWTSKRAQ